MTKIKKIVLRSSMLSMLYLVVRYLDDCDQVINYTQGLLDFKSSHPRDHFYD